MEDNQFFLMFGRLEGKVDALLSQQGRTEARLDAVEQKVADIETIKAKGTGAWQTARTVWLIVAAIVGAFTVEMKGYLFQ